MSKEKIILSFVVVFLGILVAGIAFYFYQQTKVIPQEDLKEITGTQATKESTPSFFLSLTSPKDEEVVTKKVVEVSGKTSPNAVVSIVNSVDQQVVTPDRNGDFSTTITIDNDQNILYITALSETGEEKTIKRTITFSTEDF